MKKYVLGIASFLLGIFLIIGSNERVYASEGEEKITITIDASDDNSGLLYAIDSDRPEAFSESNTFTIAAGTSHVIYVKDAAGNITSQTYTHKISNPETNEEEELNIEVGVGNTSSSSKYDYQKNMNYEYLTDTKIDNSDANVISKITTDGSDQAEKVFYTITTQEGEEFYLVIEQGSSNKVHLLNTVTLDDLAALADGEGTNNTVEQQDNLLEALKGSEAESEENIVENGDENKSTTKSNNLYIYLLIAIGGGAYYYFKIYKNKKNESMDAMDAMDMDEFVMEDEEEEEDLEFDEKGKQELLNRLLNGEEDEGETELQDMNPDEYADYIEEVDEYTEEAYATSHKEDVEDEQEEGEEIAYLTEDIDKEFDEELDGEEEE